MMNSEMKKNIVIVAEIKNSEEYNIEFRNGEVVIAPKPSRFSKSKNITCENEELQKIKNTNAKYTVRSTGEVIDCEKEEAEKKENEKLVEKVGLMHPASNAGYFVHYITEHYIGYLLILGVISFIYCLLNIFAFINYSQIGGIKVRSFNDAIFSTTIGTYYTTYQNCVKIPYKNFTQDYKFEIKCEDNFSFNKIVYMGISNSSYTEETNSQSCDTGLFDLNLNIKETCSLDSNLNILAQTCRMNSSCIIENSYDFLKPDCNNVEQFNENFYFSYECVFLDQGGFPIKGNRWPIVFICFDTLMLLLVLCLLFIMKKWKANTKEQRILINNFTVQFPNLNFYKETINSDLNIFLQKLNYSNIYEINYYAGDKNNKKINDLFITFASQVTAESVHLVKSQNRGILCCKRKSTKMPCQPSDIKWENLYYSKKSRFCYKLLSVIAAIILITISLFIVAFLKRYTTGNLDLIDKSICPTNKSYSVNELIDEYKNNEDLKLKTKTFCYCSDFIENNGITEAALHTIGNENYFICSDWTKTQITNATLSIVIGVISINIFNLIIEYVLLNLTKLERNLSKTDDFVSNLWKLFLSKAFNTGIIILLTNAKIPSLNNYTNYLPIFKGQYEDLNGGWYYNVGTTIVATLLLLIVTPHLPKIRFFYTMHKRKQDCGNYKGKGSKLPREEFLKLYVSPEPQLDSIFSYILTMLFICLIYSPGIPILWVVMFLAIVTSFFVDSYLLANFYRNPPQYKYTYTKSIHVILLYAILCHYCFAFWIYSNLFVTSITDQNSKLFSDAAYNVNSYTGPLNNYSISKYAKSFPKINTVLNNAYGIIFLILISTIALGVLWYYIIDPCYKWFGKKQVERNDVQTGLDIRNCKQINLYLFIDILLDKIYASYIGKKKTIETLNNQEYFANELRKSLESDKEFIMRQLRNYKVEVAENWDDEGIKECITKFNSIPTEQNFRDYTYYKEIEI